MTEIELAGGAHASGRMRVLWFLFGMQKKYACPQNWNELDRAQLLSIAKYLFNKHNPYVAKLMVMRQLTRMPLIALEWISNEDKLFLTDQVDWAFDVTNLSLTKQLIARYGGLYGPADKFSNMTVGEFFFADSFFLQYNKTQNVLMLDQLVAILYRHKENKHSADDTGDVRKAFNNNTIDSRVKLIAKWPAEVKHAVFLYYMGCRNDLVAKYDMIFGAPDENGSAGSNEVQTIYPYITLYAGKWGGVPGAMKVKIHSFLTDVQINLQMKKQAKPK